MNILGGKNMPKKEDKAGRTFVVGSLLAFLFSNLLLLVYGTLKTLSKKKKD